jgi:monoamine oxidase
VILGAGIAGMVLAWELRKAGFAPLILEARDRPGGRNWTLRGGDVIREAGSIQQVAWDRAPHLYFNPGPGRLPYHHQGILSYCRELGVPLEVLSNDNRGAWFQADSAFGGKPQRNRQVSNDIRGYVAELAAKAVEAKALTQAVSTDDIERIRALLRSFGALDKDMAYKGSPRAGYEVPPGSDPGVLSRPLDLRAILDAGFWRFQTNFGESWDQAATMMQPVGGMGHIGQAFGQRLRDTIVYNAEVRALRRTATGARVEWRDTRTGRTSAIEAPIVVVTIPLPVLRNISVDFAPEILAGIAAVDYVPAVKIAFQAERRFWELDDAIYGGISWTNRDITQVWYPSAGIHQQKGILVGAYIWTDDIGDKFAAMTPQDRLAAALTDGERLHAGYRQHLTKGVSVAWKNEPFSGSGWATWSAEARAQYYPAMKRGDGPFLFAGEHMSYLNGWQEGAVRSAHVTLHDIAARLKN